MAKKRDLPWVDRLRELPADASLRAKVAAVVYCGGVSGEHPGGKTYYCCEKVDALLALFTAAGGNTGEVE